MNKVQARGFSLLEVLLVLALMALLSGLALPYWQAQQYPAKRHLAWLQLQQLLLAQVEHHMQTGAYATDLVVSTNTGQKLGYVYQLQLTEDGLWLKAIVLESGPQSGDHQCWQLWLHETGQPQAFDKQGNQTLACD
jgi:prepilin-type N-terminal cleavage/methylation domain-containing protein